jgi:hypothetical protein
MRSAIADRNAIADAPDSRDTKAGGGLLRRFNAHANCIARAGSDSRAKYFRK